MFVSRMRCSAKRCTADPGPPQTVTVPGLQRTTSLRFVLRCARDTRDTSVGVTALHGLDQHGAALAAADAFGGDALLDAAALHGVDEMQHDAVAARAHGMAEADGAAVDVELVAIDAARRAIKAEHLAAE